MDSRSLELSSGLETKESRLLCSCSVQLLLAEVQLPLFEKQEVPFLLIGCSAGLRRWQAKWGQEEQEQEEQDEQAVILHNLEENGCISRCTWTGDKQVQSTEGGLLRMQKAEPGSETK